MINIVQFTVLAVNIPYISENVDQKIFIVAKRAELLQSPQRRSRVMALCQEKTDEKEMTLDVDGRQPEKHMIGRRVALNSTVVMQRLEMSVDRQL